MKKKTIYRFLFSNQLCSLKKLQNMNENVKILHQSDFSDSLLFPKWKSSVLLIDTIINNNCDRFHIKPMKCNRKHASTTVLID